MELSKVISAYHCQVAEVRALPPECQKQREIDAIKKDPRCAELLGNAEIREIRKVEGGYVVETDLDTMLVNVNYLVHDKPMCGPAKFELSFNEPIPKEVRIQPWKN